MRKWLALIVAGLFLVGCGGISMEDIKEAQTKVAELEKQGLPDSLISKAKFALNDAESAKQKGQNKLLKSRYSEAIEIIENAEKAMSTAQSDLKPALELEYSNFSNVTKELTGLHKEAAEKELAGFKKMIDDGKLYQANGKLKKLKKEFESLQKQEETASEIRKKLNGTWAFLDTAKNVEYPEINAIEKKYFKFLKNGKCSFQHIKNGQDAPNQKVFFNFKTYGDLELKGDTIHIRADRWVRTKEQIFVKDINDPGASWKLQGEGKPEDISIAKGTLKKGEQDLWIGFETLKLDYKKK